MFPLYLILFHIVFLSPKKTFSYLNSCVSGTTCQTWLGPPMSLLGLTSKTFPRCATVYNILPALTTLLILFLWKVSESMTIIVNILIILCAKGVGQGLQHHDQCLLQCQVERSKAAGQQRLQQGGTATRGNFPSLCASFFLFLLVSKYYSKEGQ